MPTGSHQLEESSQASCSIVVAGAHLRDVDRWSVWFVVMILDMIRAGAKDFVLKKTKTDRSLAEDELCMCQRLQLQDPKHE